MTDSTLPKECQCRIERGGMFAEVQYYIIRCEFCFSMDKTIEELRRQLQEARAGNVTPRAEMIPADRERKEVLLEACKRALAIEESVTQEQERELRQGFVPMLRAAIAFAEAQS